MIYPRKVLFAPHPEEPRSGVSKDEARMTRSGLMVRDGAARLLTMRRRKSHMPDFVGYLIERRMPVDLGFRRLEQHALVDRIGGGDRARRYHPDRESLAAAGIDVARGLQRHGGIGRMQRATMLVREPVAAADEDFPERRVRRGHGDLPVAVYSAVCATWRDLRFSALAAAASRTHAPSACALRRAAIRSR